MNKKIIKEKNLETLLKTMENEINALVDTMVVQAKIPNDPFNSMKNKMKQDIFQSMGGKDHWKRIPHGFKLIKNDLKAHLSKREFEAQKLEFENAMSNIKLLNNEKANSVEELAEKLEGTPDTLQELFGLSDQIIECFYQSGCRYYATSHFKDASDAFYTITFLNPFIFNVWLSLGLSELKLHHYEKALEAFAMATLMNVTSVIPHIQSVECYIHLKEYPLAKETLELAHQVLQEYPAENSQFDQQSIQRLNNQISNK